MLSKTKGSARICSFGTLAFCETDGSSNRGRTWGLESCSSHWNATKLSRMYEKKVYFWLYHWTSIWRVDWWSSHFREDNGCWNKVERCRLWTAMLATTSTGIQDCWRKRHGGWWTIEERSLDNKQVNAVQTVRPRDGTTPQYLYRRPMSRVYVPTYMCKARAFQGRLARDVDFLIAT